MLFVLEMSVFLSLGSRTPDPHLRKWLNGRPTRRASHPKLVLFFPNTFLIYSLSILKTGELSRLFYLF